MVIDSSFWAGKRVFVTGHTGFKGSWLSLWLQSMGARVSGYSLSPPTKPSLFETGRVAEGMQSRIGDVRDLPGLLAAMKADEPEVVFHLAAQPLVRYSYREPVETYATNVMGTVNVLEAARQTPTVRAIVIITSDKCYENHEWVWGYRETDALGGYDPYSNSKGCTELVTAAYRSSYFNPKDYDRHRVAIASVRAGNVIGGGDWAEDRLIPDVVRALSGRRPVVIRNPAAVRPWQHVLEPLAGYLAIAEKLATGGPAWSEAWNFGPEEGDARPVQWIVERMCAAWGEGASWERDPGSNPHEAQYLRLDIAKVKSRLGWRPRWNLETGLYKTIDWYRACDKGADMRAYTQAQIRDYVATTA